MEFKAPLLPEFNNPFQVFSFLINTPVFMILFAVFFIFYLILSIVLIYHWSAYGMKSPGILVAESFYIFVSLVLFALASLALYYI